MERETEHYIFHYSKNSTAEKDIVQISSVQEECYGFISNCLETNAQGKIHYHFFDTPEEVGKQYAITHNDNDDEPCNGFALSDTISEDGANHIYAVYNDNIKCIGAHEDAHIISYSLGRPISCFIREGLAMFFDRYWWGIDNYSWTLWYLENESLPSIKSLFHNEFFKKYDDVTVYPIAGAFTSYLIERYGMNKYIEFYKICVDDAEKSCKSAFGAPITAIEKNFINHIKTFHLRKEIRELITKSR